MANLQPERSSARKSRAARMMAYGVSLSIQILMCTLSIVLKYNSGKLGGIARGEPPDGGPVN